MKHGFAGKMLAWLFLGGLPYLVFGAVTEYDAVNISAETTYTVAEGDTVRIEYLYGSAKIINKCCF